MNPRIPHHKVPRASIISESEVSITVLCYHIIQQYESRTVRKVYLLLK